jgi:hypothetical protein
MIAAVIWIAGAFLAGWIGHRKGMTSLGVVLGVVFAFVGAIIMACIPRTFHPVWQGWMRRLHGRGRIIAGALLLLAWMFVPSISHSGISIAQEHAECQGGLGSVARLFDPGIAVDCNDISTLYTFLTLAAAAGLVLVLWGVWVLWGALLLEQTRKFSATARPAFPQPPQQYPPPAPPQPPAPGCTCGADHEPGDVFCGRCGGPVWSPASGPA